MTCVKNTTHDSNKQNQFPNTMFYCYCPSLKEQIQCFIVIVHHWRNKYDVLLLLSIIEGTNTMFYCYCPSLKEQIQI